MRQLPVSALGLMICLAPAPPALATGTTSPGKTSVHVSVTGAPFNLTPSSNRITLAGTIAKGKKKEVLTIDAMAQTERTASATNEIELTLTVNGFAVEPARTLSDNRTCSLCGLAGHWWLDLDAAEAAHPGMFIGQPLDIQLIAVN